MMKLENKYNIGEEVYTIIRKNLDLTCPLCEGEKKIVFKGNDIKCPECKGEGKIKSKHQVWEVLEDKLKIRRIKVSVGESNQTIKYLLNGSFYVNSRPEKHLFKTIEDAKKCCLEYNN